MPAIMATQTSQSFSCTHDTTRLRRHASLLGARWEVQSVLSHNESEVSYLALPHSKSAHTDTTK